jgi:hypothetical protein
MATAVTSLIEVSLQATHSEAYDLGTSTLKSTLAKVLKQLTWSSGTGANAADRMFSDTRTLGPSAGEDLDLAGSLVDAFGATMTFARIKLLWIYADSANNAANPVQLTRPAANGVPLFLAAGDGISLNPGAGFLWFDPTATGVAVTATTADLLHVTNGAGTNSVNYDVLIIGASA